MSVSKRTLYKNVLFLTVADGAAKGATGLLSLIIARFLGPTLYGPYAIASAVAGLFMMATCLGFEEEFTRQGGRDPLKIKAVFRLNMRALLVTSLAAFIGLAVFLSSGVYAKETVQLTLLMMAALIAARFHFPFRQLCLLLGKSHMTALIQMVSTSFLFAGTVVLILHNTSLYTIVGAQLTVALLALAWWLGWKSRLDHSDHFKDEAKAAPAQTLLEFARKAFPFAVTNLLWIMYFNVGSFFLSLMKTEKEVGIFGGVFRIIAVTYIIGYAVANTFTPLLFRTFSEKKEEFKPHAKHLLVLMLALGLPLSLGFAAYSDVVVPLIIGKEFADGAAIARILSLSIAFRMINFALEEIITTANRQSARILLEGSMLVFYILACLSLIPTYGSVGVAWAILFAEMMLSVGGVAVVWKVLKTSKKAPDLHPEGL